MGAGDHAGISMFIDSAWHSFIPLKKISVCGRVECGDAAAMGLGEVQGACPSRWCPVIMHNSTCGS